ncbi:hypothetical protein [Bacillus gaemokensis]|nr:hypothetical protein [Bacillus gaemokensis]
MKKIGLIGFVAAMIMTLGITSSNDTQQAKSVSKDSIIQYTEHGTGW